MLNSWGGTFQRHEEYKHAHTIAHCHWVSFNPTPLLHAGLICSEIGESFIGHLGINFTPSKTRNQRDSTCQINPYHYNFSDYSVHADIWWTEHEIGHVHRGAWWFDLGLEQWNAHPDTQRIGDDDMKDRVWVMIPRLVHCWLPSIVVLSGELRFLGWAGKLRGS